MKSNILRKLIIVDLLIILKIMIFYFDFLNVC